MFSFISELKNNERNYQDQHFLQILLQKKHVHIDPKGTMAN